MDTTIKTPSFAYANANVKLALALIGLPCLLAANLLHAQELSGRTKTYTVAKGDTVQSVSNSLLDDPKRFLDVAKASKLKDPNRIYPGNVLQVPVELLRGDATPMKLSTVNGDVKVDGAPAQAGMAVKEGAKVETAEGATAVLTRNDGTNLTMLPNSIAELTKNRSVDKEAGLLRSSIRLVSGAMDFVVQKLGLKDHVKVDTPTSTIGVRGTQYRVGSQTKSSKVEVIEGTVAADSAGAKLASTALALNGGYGTIVPEGGKPLGAIALLPAPTLANLSTGASLIRENNALLINPVPQAVAYSYVVSPEGQPTVQTLAGRVDKATINLPRLPNGNYQIAVRALDRNGLAGFDTVVPFKLEVSDKPFSLLAKPYEQGFVTSWDNGSPGSLYIVQLSRDASFKQLVAEGYVREQQAMMKDLEPGSYFWRVGEAKNKAAKEASQAGGWNFSEPQRINK